MKDLESKILIEIPSYNDEQLVPTVTSALAQAENPSRVRIAICYQGDDMRDYETLGLIRGIKLVHVPLSEARGSCYARKLCQGLLDDEDYVLHIDSHMRFIKNWDSAMISQWQACGDPKAVLSSYAPSLKPELLSARVTDPVFDNPAKGTVMKPLEIRSEKEILRHCSIAFRGRAFQDDDAEPKRCPWIAGGFVFAKAGYDMDIPFDPDMYFCGDELPIALRAYTHGYTSYAPRKMYVLHWYSRPTRTMPDDRSPAVKAKRESEKERLMALFGMTPPGRKPPDLGAYGLGSERSLEDFERDSGVSLRNNSVLYRALAGYYYDDYEDGREGYGDIVANEAMSERDRIRSAAYEAMRREKIYVIMPCGDESETKACMDSARSTAARPLRLRFITVAEESAAKNFTQIVSKIIPDGSTYGAYIEAGLEDIPDDAITIIIDPGIRFAAPCSSHAWDEDLIWNLVSSGQNGDCTVIAQHIADIPGKAGVNSAYMITGFQGDNPTYAGGRVSARNGTYIPSLHNDAIAARADVFKDVKPDPSLCREDFLISYSIRLWTYGYDIYHAPDTYVSAEKGLVGRIGPASRRPDIIGNILCCVWDNAYRLPIGYEYGPGSVRAAKRWESEMNVNYGRHKLLGE